MTWSFSVCSFGWGFAGKDPCSDLGVDLSTAQVRIIIPGYFGPIIREAETVLTCHWLLPEA